MASRGTALVVGSTAGIGASIAEHLLDGGIVGRVVMNGRNTEAGLARQNELCRRWGRQSARFIRADVRDPAESEELFRAIEQEHGGLDVMVFSPGSGTPGVGIFATIDPDSYRPLVEGHFLSLLNCCRFAIPLMTARGGGSIVAIASDAGKVATPGEAIIGAMKAAVIMFARTLALEVSRHGIRVNCITPSLVRDTPAYDVVMQHEHGRKIFARAEARARLGLPGPEDLAALAVFLCGPGARRITGQAISVNGGISAA